MAEKVFSSLESDSLHDIIEHENIFIDEEEPKKGQLVAGIVKYVEQVAFNLMSEQLSRDELEQACKHVKADLSGTGKHPTKAVLRKRLLEKMEETGLNKFLDKFHDNIDLLVSFSDTVGLEEEEEPEKIVGKNKAKEIGKEIDRVGMEAVFSRFDVNFLKGLCEQLNITANTINKSKVIKAIITGKSVKASTTAASTIKKAKEASMQEAKEAAKKKSQPSIKKGITYQDMFQQYLRQELFDWCKKNGLKVSGSKPELIKRILAYLDGDIENTMAVENKKVGKKEKEVKVKKPAKKAKKTEEPKEEEEKEKETTKEKEPKEKETTKEKKESAKEKETKEKEAAKDKKESAKEKETKEKEAAKEKEKEAKESAKEKEAAKKETQKKKETKRP